MLRKEEGPDRGDPTHDRSLKATGQALANGDSQAPGGMRTRELRPIRASPRRGASLLLLLKNKLTAVILHREFGALLEAMFRWEFFVSRELTLA